MRRSTCRERGEVIIVGMSKSTCHGSEVFGGVNWNKSTVDLEQDRESLSFGLVTSSQGPGASLRR